MFRLRAPSFYVAIAICLASCAWSSISEARVAKTLRAGQANPFTVEGKVNTLDQNKLTLNTEENMISTCATMTRPSSRVTTAVPLAAKICA